MKRQYKLKPDPVDLRDHIFKTASIVHPVEFPPEIDLRPQMSPIVDQGELGSCTANAIVCGLREFMELKAGNPLAHLSRLYLYWHERDVEGDINEDGGAILRDGMNILATMGVCPEADFPYDVTKFTKKPSDQAEKDATPFKIASFHRIYDLNGLKACLVEGYPAVIGMQVYESFESDAVATNGMVPFPSFGEQCLGGHAVCVAGYKTIGREEYLIVRNSWGSQWGDKGYCYIPSSFIAKNIITDMWTGR